MNFLLTKRDKAKFVCVVESKKEEKQVAGAIPIFGPVEKIESIDKDPCIQKYLRGRGTKLVQRFLFGNMKRGSKAL